MSRQQPAVHVFTAWPAATSYLRQLLAERFSVTLHCTWVGKTRSGTVLSGKRSLLADTVINTGKMLWSRDLYRPETVLVCHTAHYSGLVVGRFLRLLRPSGRVYLFNFYIHGMGRRPFVRRILRWLFRQNLAIAVQSKVEYDYFRGLAPLADVRYIPFGQNGPKEIAPHQITPGDYIFSGGYTNRDYGLLIECARQLQHIRFVIACSRLNRIPPHVPDNVEIMRDIEFTQFHTLLAGSRLVVVPLLDDVGAAGQMVALAAMKFRKTVIYPNFDVLSQYFTDNESGIEYEAGNLGSLNRAITSSYDDMDRLSRIGAEAHLQWKQGFTKECFDTAIARHIISFVEGETSVDTGFV